MRHAGRRPGPRRGRVRRPFVLALTAEPTRLGDSRVLALWTGREDGDQRTLARGSLPAAVPEDLCLVRPGQVHRARVEVLGGESDAICADRGGSIDISATDAVVTASPAYCLAVLTADCAAVALGSSGGLFAAVHVGWRGLALGVVENALDEMYALGAREVEAGIGPCIHPCCYAFDGAELERLESRYGPRVRSRTTRGEVALDLPSAVRAALGERASVVEDSGTCTGCRPEFFSHRSRREKERQALFVWTEVSGT